MEMTGEVKEFWGREKEDTSEGGALNVLELALANTVISVAGGGDLRAVMREQGDARQKMLDDLVVMLKDRVRKALGDKVSQVPSVLLDNMKVHVGLGGSFGEEFMKEDAAKTVVKVVLGEGGNALIFPLILEDSVVR